MMDGFKKYLIIIGITVIGLWLLSIMIYWDVIGNYFSQSVNGILDSGIQLVIYLIALVMLIGAAIGGFRR